MPPPLVRCDQESHIRDERQVATIIKAEGVSTATVYRIIDNIHAFGTYNRATHSARPSLSLAGHPQISAIRKYRPYANIGLLIYIYNNAIYKFLNHLLSNAYLLIS